MRFNRTSNYTQASSFTSTSSPSSPLASPSSPWTSTEWPSLHPEVSTQTLLVNNTVINWETSTILPPNLEKSTILTPLWENSTLLDPRLENSSLVSPYQDSSNSITSTVHYFSNSDNFVDNSNFDNPLNISSPLPHDNSTFSSLDSDYSHNPKLLNGSSTTALPTASILKQHGSASTILPDPSYSTYTEDSSASQETTLPLDSTENSTTASEAWQIPLFSVLGGLSFIVILLVFIYIYRVAVSRRFTGRYQPNKQEVLQPVPQLVLQLPNPERLI